MPVRAYKIDGYSVTTTVTSDYSHIFLSDFRRFLFKEGVQISIFVRFLKIFVLYATNKPCLIPSEWENNPPWWDFH